VNAHNSNHASTLGLSENRQLALPPIHFGGNAVSQALEMIRAGPEAQIERVEEAILTPFLDATEPLRQPLVEVRWAPLKADFIRAAERPWDPHWRHDGLGCRLRRERWRGGRQRRLSMSVDRWARLQKEEWTGSGKRTGH